MTVASDLATARRVIAGDPPSVVILDVALPDGDSLSLLPLLRVARPQPPVIAMSGSASPDQGFRLAEAGVRAFLPKPIDLTSLEAAWNRALSRAPDLTPHLRAQVGSVPLHDLEEQVRHTVVEEALARTTGSVRGAARLLGISRQLLQQILRKWD